MAGTADAQTRLDQLGRPHRPSRRRQRFRPGLAGRRDWGGLWFLLPSFAGVMLFVLIPFADVVRRSFHSAMNGTFVGLQNYSALFQNKAFLQAAGNTARFMGICMPLLIGLSLLVALLLCPPARASQSAARSNTTDVFKTIFLIPLAIPVASVAFLWRSVFHSNGLLSGFLAQAGLPTANWMNSEWAFWVLIASYVWKNLGYDLVLWIAGLSSIPPTLYEAAAVDGANRWTTFRRITLPQLLPSLFTITVLSFLNSFKVFREAYLVAGDYPHPSMYLLQHLFNNWFRDLSMDRLCAAAVMVALVTLALILLLRRAWEEDDS